MLLNVPEVSTSTFLRKQHIETELISPASLKNKKSIVVGKNKDVDLCCYGYFTWNKYSDM